jgi:LPXTG-site transpeptidase (sortase) family protein
MEIRRKRRSKSSIAFIIFIILFLMAGLVLLIYPFITGIPSLFQRSGQITAWQSLKDKSSGEQLTDLIGPAVTESSIEPEDNISGQDTKLQNSTVSTEAPENTVIQNNIKYSARDIFPAKLTIPRISVEWITNEGSEIVDLKKGPGHIPQTPLPGESGRCTISGHRTTYGAPFSRIDELKKGDMIYLEALNGNKYFYQVTSFQIIKPTYVEILNGTDRKELLLSTCYPEYSARERLVIIAEMVTVFPLDLDLK